MNDKTRPRSRKTDLVVQEVDSELLIYDLVSNKAYCLNKTSALVLQACNGKRTVPEINEHLGEQLSTKTQEDIVWLALDQLGKEKLLEERVDLEGRFGDMSRRQVIKKVGLGSMVALPIVSSLVAPTASHAQTSVCGTNLLEDCRCMVSIFVCNGLNNGAPAPFAPCTAVGGAGTAICTSTSPSCTCQGPFTCGPATFKNGFCRSS